MAQFLANNALPDGKADRYSVLLSEIQSVIEGETNVVAKMATTTSMLAAAFEAYLWTGFYVVDPLEPEELVVGPYQGTLGCLRIAFGRGVCGAAARSRQTVVVPDVESYPGHIACDPRSRSEIVVPVLNARGELLAVLDVDSAEPAAFDEIDQAGLEAIARHVFAI